jgi:hypothetical protein
MQRAGDKKHLCDRRETSKLDLREELAEDAAKCVELCFRSCPIYCRAKLIAALFFWDLGCSTREAFGAQISDGIGHVAYQRAYGAHPRVSSCASGATRNENRRNKNLKLLSIH